MSSGIDFEFIGAADILAKLDKLPEEVTVMAKSVLSGAASDTYDASQSDVPVDQGNLKDSGKITAEDNGLEFHYDVSYGDGQGYGAKYGIYDGYSWFVELGHRTRSGTTVPPNMYLGPNFDSVANATMETLRDMFS